MLIVRSRFQWFRHEKSGPHFYQKKKKRHHVWEPCFEIGRPYPPKGAHFGREGAAKKRAHSGLAGHWPCFPPFFDGSVFLCLLWPQVASGLLPPQPPLPSPSSPHTLLSATTLHDGLSHGFCWDFYDRCVVANKLHKHPGGRKHLTRVLRRLRAMEHPHPCLFLWIPTSWILVFLCLLPPRSSPLVPLHKGPVFRVLEEAAGRTPCRSEEFPRTRMTKNPVRAIVEGDLFLLLSPRIVP